MKIKTEHTFCRICESLCGLEVDTIDNKIVNIRPDANHITTYGFACPKGLKQHKMYDSPDRLSSPLIKKNGEWCKSSWEKTLKEIGEKVKKIIKEDGPNAIGMYVGTAAGFGVLHPIFAQGFMDGIGSNNLFSSASQDCSNKFAVSQRMYGYPFTLTFPDILNTDFLIIVGANPIVSKWSFLQVPNPSLHLKNILKKGGEVVVVDPRKTETAKIAKSHIPIRPNTDVFFYLSFLNELIRINQIDKSWISNYTTGFDELFELAKRWSGERTESLTGIPTAILKDVVKKFHSAKRASIYCSTGVNMGTHGALSFWIQECINIISGNLDKEGGALVSKGIIDFPSFGKKNGRLLRSDKSRVHSFHSTNDAFPGGLLADEILTRGNGQIKALFVTGGNPLITMANSNRLREAFSSLELLVTLDIYPNETGSIGHYMLPCTSPLERPDLPFIFPLMLGLQTKPYLQATKSMIEPQGEQRDEASIYLDLCKYSGVNIFGSWTGQKVLEIFSFFNSIYSKKKQKSIPQEFLLNLILKLSGQKGFKSLLKHKSGYELDSHEAGTFVPDRVLTDDKKIALAPHDLLEEAQNLDLFFQEELEAIQEYRLITKRDVTTHNSWTHNIDEFTKGDRYTNYLYLNPSDAEDLSLSFKDLAKVSTDIGSIVLPVKITNDLNKKTVAIPHGWGHQSTSMKIAKNTSGVNVNILASDGIDSLERISGMSHLTGIKVKIERFQGDFAPNSWSGLKEEQLEVPQILQ
tara:strand:- start:336 stop:2579 length:2244 start_codon:yes stop_codon:yes gene_type:complete